MDLYAVSYSGLTQTDADRIKELDSVNDVEGFYTAEAILSLEERTASAKFISLPERINTLTLREGRFPENKNECVILRTKDFNRLMDVGNTITLSERSIPQNLFLLNSAAVQLAPAGWTILFIPQKIASRFSMLQACIRKSQSRSAVHQSWILTAIFIRKLSMRRKQTSKNDLVLTVLYSTATAMSVLQATRAMRKKSMRFQKYSRYFSFWSPHSSV